MNYEEWKEVKKDLEHELNNQRAQILDFMKSKLYDKDPYAHLKEAQERGEVIQLKHGGWQDMLEPTDFPYDVDRYRIKPRAIADDDIDWDHKTVCEFVDNNYWHNPEDAIGDIRKMVYKERRLCKPQFKCHCGFEYDTPVGCSYKGEEGQKCPKCYCDHGKPKTKTLYLWAFRNKTGWRRMSKILRTPAINL
jgi:hypothetical protein